MKNLLVFVVLFGRASSTIEIRHYIVVIISFGSPVNETVKSFFFTKTKIKKNTAKLLRNIPNPRNGKFLSKRPSAGALWFSNMEPQPAVRRGS